ncbi:MAG: hypothetical protein WBQ94_23235 [Terracidiphilus sp.]
MCPVCLAAAALVAVKATSTGGLAALAIMKTRAKTIAPKIPIEPGTKEDQNVQHYDSH